MEALGFHVLVLLIPDTGVLRTGLRAAATTSRICHCRFPSTRHCSGNCMCKVELPAPNLDKGAAWRGGLGLKQRPLCPIMCPSKSHK